MTNEESTCDVTTFVALPNGNLDPGFYEDYDRVMSLLEDPKDKEFLKKIWLSHRLMLIVSELAEGLEAIRDSNLRREPKSGGLGEELANVEVRLRDLWEHIFSRSCL